MRSAVAAFHAKVVAIFSNKCFAIAVGLYAANIVAHSCKYEHM